MEKSCPLGWTCDKCLWHVHLTGIHPSTGIPVDEFKCAMAWLPVLLVQQTQQVLQTAASVDRVHDVMAGALTASLESPPERRLIEQ